MKLTHLLNVQNPWLKLPENDSGVVFATWLRLSRNIKGFPFLRTINKKDKLTLRDMIIEKIGASLKSYRLSPILLDKVKPEDLLLLKERALIEKTNATFVDAAALLHNTPETNSILINGSDHIRMQLVQSGLSGPALWEQISHLDNELMQIFPYAYNEQFGFLTSAITQAGTALKAEILVHLPISVFTGKINQKMHQLQNEGISVKHFFEKSSLPIGNLFVLSNQKTLGITESEIIEKLEASAMMLSVEEINIRENLFQTNREEMLDKIHRSFGLLSNSYRISAQEAFTYLSILKIGIDTKIIDFISTHQWCRLFQSILPAHIAVEKGVKVSKEVVDEARSDILKRKLKSFEQNT